MASTGVSTYRDRTSEFQSLSETLKKIGRIAVSDESQNGPATSKPPATSYRSEFNKKASRIGLGVHETSQKIARLAKLAKRSSIFDDPIKEIQELTTLIKDDITTLNSAVSDLQTLQNLEMADENCSDDRIVHSTTVCDDLKNKLMGTTKQFQDVLTTRTENIKAHENRRQIFSTNISRENPLNCTKTVTEPPPWSSSSNSSGSLQPSVLLSNGVPVGSQLRCIVFSLCMQILDGGWLWITLHPTIWKCPCCSRWSHSRIIIHKVGQLLFKTWNPQFQNSVGSLPIWRPWLHTKGNWPSGLMITWTSH